MFPRVRLSPTAVNRCQRLSRTTILSPQKDSVLSSLPLSRISVSHGMSSVSTHELALTPGVLFLHLPRQGGRSDSSTRGSLTTVSDHSNRRDI